jgi:integrase/recombinase XerD
VGGRRPGRPGEDELAEFVEAAVVGRARAYGSILLNSRGSRMDRHAATRRLRRLGESVGI